MIQDAAQILAPPLGSRLLLDWAELFLGSWDTCKPRHLRGAGTIILLHSRKPGIGIGCRLSPVSKQGLRLWEPSCVAALSALDGRGVPNLHRGGPGCVLATPGGQIWSLRPSACQIQTVLGDPMDSGDHCN